MPKTDPYYSQDGKSSYGLHVPFTCPFCGPSRGETFAEKDKLEISIEKHVSIPTDFGDNSPVTIVYCTKCTKILSVVPEEVSE